MKIAFVSTRGIPNNYGGFEQFAEYISVKLIQEGHEVEGYSSLILVIKALKTHSLKLKNMYKLQLI